jgi:hypothetical protein
MTVVSCFEQVLCLQEHGPSQSLLHHHNPMWHLHHDCYPPQH